MNLRGEVTAPPNNKMKTNKELVKDFKRKLKEYHQAITNKIGYLLISRNISLDEEQKIYEEAMKILKKIK